MRDRQLLLDQLAHRHLDPQQLAEIALQHAFDPIDVLDRDRLIELVLRTDMGDGLGVAFLAGHHQCRIAGQQMLQRKDQDRDKEQRRDQLQDTLGEKVQHRLLVTPLPAESRSSLPRKAERSTTMRCAGRAAPKMLRPSSLQLQSDHTHQSVRHLLVAFKPGGVRNQDSAVVDDKGWGLHRARAWSAFHR